jgi:lipid-A-disaccharide synthase
VTHPDYAARYNLDPDKPWITLMPGSRRKEVGMILPTILESAARLGPEFEYLLPVAPTLDRNLLKAALGDSRIALVDESLPALHHSRAAIVASGTATVEAAMMSTPFVMVYRVTPLTYALGKPRIKVPYFAMVNLIAGGKIVPELVQDDFTPPNVNAELRKILPDGAARAAMLKGFDRAKSLLRSPDPHDTRSAAERAAAIILEMLHLPTAARAEGKQPAPA